MTEKSPYYLHCFTHLKRDMKNGGAPHKPILLLSIIRLFEDKIFVNNQIHILPELVGVFKNIWSELVITNHHPVFALPFYHMNSEPFWQLVPNFGCEKWVKSKNSISSLQSLTTAVNFALIDDDLSNLLKQQESRGILQMAILDQYFPKTKHNYQNNQDNTFLNSSLIEQESEKYKRTMLEMKNKIDENAFQEEVFIRSGLFKREIVKIYNNTCAISRLRIDTLINTSMVDACHIVPFSESYDDTLTNGIALCPNLHRAFDRGLISVSDDYKVLVNKIFVENQSVYNLSQFEGKQILLPNNSRNYPLLENFEKHRKKHNFPHIQRL